MEVKPRPYDGDPPRLENLTWEPMGAWVHYFDNREDLMVTRSRDGNYTIFDYYEKPRRRCSGLSELGVQCYLTLAYPER